MLLLGVVGIGSHNALAYLGLNFTTATNGVILNSFIPIMIIALSWIFLRQRLSPVLSFLFVIACVGDSIMLPFYLGETALGYRMSFSPVNIAALLSVALFSSVLA